MIVVLSAEAAVSIAREAPASADGRETGGVMLGHDLDERLVVTVAGDPGPKADRRADGFVRDLRHAQRLGDDAYDRDGSVWIGEWHTHPGGPITPSPTDLKTYAQLLSDDDLGFERVLSIIVTPCPLHGWEETSVTAWVVDRTAVHHVEVAAEGPTSLCLGGGPDNRPCWSFIGALPAE